MAGSSRESALARALARAMDALARLFTGTPYPTLDTRAVTVALEPVKQILAQEDLAAVKNALTGVGAPSVLLSTGFDLIDPDVQARAEQQAARLVTQVTEEVRAFIADVTVQAVSGDLTWAQAAARIRTRIGLTDRWALAVEKGRADVLARHLAAGMKPARALALADAHAERHRTRLVRVRAETIARTEIMLAQNAGRLDGWRRAQAQGLLPVTARKRWIVAPDGTRRGKVCDVCAPLGKQPPVLLNEPFSTGYLMPPAHPRCRCTAVITTKG